jgi:hypothetical protein
VRRLIIAVLLCGAAFLAVAATSSGAPSSAPAQLAGPRLAVAASGGPNPGERLVTIGPLGEEPVLVLRPGERGPEITHPVWNAAGTELAFFGPGLRAGVIELVGADGSGPRVLATSESLGATPGAAVKGEPVFDPTTGQILVTLVHTPHGKGLFSEERRGLTPVGPIRTEFWELPVDGSKGRLLSSHTVGSKRAMIPSLGSIASDGTVAATALTPRGLGVVTIDPQSGAARTVVPLTAQFEGTLDPAISPDGTEIAYKVDVPRYGRYGRPVGTIGTDLMVVATAGGKPRRLARVKGLAGGPSWDPSGSRIAFTAYNDSPGTIYTSGFGQVGSSVMEINADGTCLTRVYSVPGGAVSGAAWQPGEGRGVGPISC